MECKTEELWNTSKFKWTLRFSVFFHNKSIDFTMTSANMHCIGIPMKEWKISHFFAQRYYALLPLLRVCRRSHRIHERGLWLHCRFDAIALSVIYMMDRSIITSLNLFASDTVFIVLMFNSDQQQVSYSTNSIRCLMENHTYDFVRDAYAFAARSTESTRCHYGKSQSYNKCRK